jgi:hypothetical protein
MLSPAGPTSQSVAPLDYAPRGGGRHEGLRTIPVAGYDIELLSAHVGVSDPRDAPPRQASWADDVRLRFYLPDNGRVVITARQLLSRSSYYWLDDTGSPFRAKVVNLYSWPTEPVLKQLPRNFGLTDPRDLGVKVRLGETGQERVLPALVEGSLGTASRVGYQFTLKTNGRANVTATFYADDGDEALFRSPGAWQPANRPFVVNWDAALSPEGWYRLVLSGWFENNAQLGKTIRFYHRPELLRGAAAR